jgi:hypothetical protein
MPLSMHPLRRLLRTVWRWLRFADVTVTSTPNKTMAHPSRDKVATHPYTLPLDGEAFEAFLRQLGVELEHQTRHEEQAFQQEARITLLEQSRHYNAWYRVDLVGNHPHLLVLIPADHPLLFESYQVRLHACHPLADTLEHLAYFQGSQHFEQERPLLEEEILFAITESMKALFWAGFSTGQFPHEIIVHKLRLIAEAVEKKPEG